MQDLKSALDKADGKALGPNHVEACFIKALQAPTIPTGPSSAAPRRRCTEGKRTSGSAPRYRALPDWTTTGP